MQVGIRVVRPVSTVKEGLMELDKLADRFNAVIKTGKCNKVIINYLEDHYHLGIEVDADVKHVITYAPNQQQSTRLWAIAHELGHLILTETVRESQTKTTLSSSRTFWEAEAELQAWKITDALLSQLNPKFYSVAYMRWKQKQLRTYYEY